MTMEVRNLLSQEILDMSGHGSENSTLRSPNPVGHPYTSPHKPKELLQPVDTPSQANTQEDAEMAEASLP